MASYIPTIGLEIHAELQTATKMFCACRNDADEKRPNQNICPVCMSHPGSLPVINREAVHKVLLVGTALGSKLADYTEFDRKNYFYPDIPKGYQLSQFAYPLVLGGALSGVDITRIHLEEDTARNQHEGDKSLIDYNRAGVPLMELVTEPVLHSAEDAGAFARELQILLRYLRAGEANMEKGEMRVEANISVAPVGADTEINTKDDKLVLGTKVEVKNINSFRSVERAITYEIARQTALLDSGGKVEQETLGWDEGLQKTYVQRKKENSHDYRYFPDPDLPKLKLSEIPEFAVDALKKELPELPWEKRARYIKEGAKKEYADRFVQDEALAGLFDSADNKELAANYIGSDIAGLAVKYGGAGISNITVSGFNDTIFAITEGKLSSRGAKDALTEVFEKGGDLSEVIKKYEQQSDEGALTAMAQKVLDANPTVVADYKAGKAASLMFLVGQGMKESKGSANPEVLKAIFINLLA